MPDSNECRNIITSEDYADFIIEYNTSQSEFLERYSDYCPQVVGTRYGIAYEKLENILPIRVQEYSYRAVPKLYGEMDTEAVEATGSVRLQNVTGLNLKGQDVIIGVIDSGERVNLMQVKKYAKKSQKRCSSYFYEIEYLFCLPVYMYA